MTADLTQWLARAEALDGAATKGPWPIVVYAEPGTTNKWTTIRGPDGASVGWAYAPQDNALIAHMRNHHAAMLEVVRAAQERAYEGHDDLCPKGFYGVNAKCSCGHDDLQAALAALAKVQP